MRDPRSKDNIELHNLNNHFPNILSKQRPSVHPHNFIEEKLTKDKLFT